MTWAGRPVKGHPVRDDGIGGRIGEGEERNGQIWSVQVGGTGEALDVRGNQGTEHSTGIRDTLVFSASFIWKFFKHSEKFK